MTTPDPQTLLISVYRQAYYQVVKLLIAAAAADRSLAYYQAIRNDIAGILAGLDPAAQKWITQNIPQAYRAGMGDAVSGLSAAGVTAPLSVSPMIGIHRSAVEILANNLFGDLTASSQFMGRQVNDLFRQAGISEALTKVSTGNTVRGASKNLKAALQSRGVTAFQDSAGKQWRLDSYAAMAIRSTTREATNRGTLNQLSSLGYDLVTIPPHSPTCELCAPFQGRVYSITGKDKRFPRLWLTAFAGGYANIHPNCSHVVTPYIADLADDLASDIERSNAPFDVDPRSEAERQAFANGQASKRQANADRLQWERYKARLGDDAPSFATFRRIKNADGDAWDKLQGKYRNAGRSTKEEPTPVSAALDVNIADDALRGNVEHAIDVIDSVHTDGDLPKIPITTLASDDTAFGRFQWNSGKPVDIQISADGDHPLLTTAHETGHFLDYSGLPGQGLTTRNVYTAPPEIQAALAHWFDSVSQTDAYKQWQTFESSGIGYKEAEPDAPKFATPINKAYATYNLDTAELFARSYAQYIAVSSSDPAMLKELDGMRARAPGEVYFPRQWEADDFGPIKSAMDDLFKVLGWI